MKLNARRLFLALAFAAALRTPATAGTVTLRVVTYNIAADVDGYTAARPGLDTVLEAIGQQNVNGVVQPADVIALEETTSNAATVTPLASTLNTFYGATIYASSPYQATEAGNSPSVGNGPNAVLYNTQDPRPAGKRRGRHAPGFDQRRVSADRALRIRADRRRHGQRVLSLCQPHEEQLQRHAAAVQAARAAEAQILRTDSATLPVGAGVIYTGDFNLDGSSEAAYQTLTATGAAQGVDPFNTNPQDNTEEWDSAAFVSIDTESATSLRYRDDIQFISANVYGGTISGGLRFLAGSNRIFGNNGTTGFQQSVNSSSNTSLANLQGSISASTALSALTMASDHLPVVVDYAIGLPAPPAPLPPTPAPVVTSAPGAGGLVGTPFSFQVTADNSPTGFGATGLPAGLTIDAVSGLITGTLTTVGTYTVTLSATSATGTGTAPFTITVAAGLPTATLAATIPSVVAGSGGIGEFTLSLSQAQDHDVIVSVTIRGSAVNGTDYVAIKTSKKIKAGKTSRTIKVIPLGTGGGPGVKRSVTLSLGANTGYTVGTAGKVKVKIIGQ